MSLNLHPYTEAGAKGADAAPLELRGWKWVKFSGKAKAGLNVKTIADGRGGLDAYLQLPAEEYALLDPKYVERSSPTSFRFTVPLREALRGMYGNPLVKELTPSIMFTTVRRCRLTSA